MHLKPWVGFLPVASSYSTRPRDTMLPVRAIDEKELMSRRVPEYVETGPDMCSLVAWDIIVLWKTGGKGGEESL